MNKRERVLMAISHQQTDQVPYTVDFTWQARERMLAWPGGREALASLDHPISSVYWDGWLEEISPGSGYWRDWFGVTWNRNGADKDIGVIEGLVMPEPDLEAYTFPPLDEKRLRASLEKLASADPDACRMGAIGFSLFERAWTLRGMENFLIDMASDPAFAEGLLTAITDYQLQIVRIALEYPLDGFHFGDDWGQQQGMIMGPDYWRRFIKPQLARLYEPVKAAGMFVSQHSCGDISAVFPDLIEIGLDVYQTVQPEIYDLALIKQEYGRDLTFWGGISTQRLLPFADEETIRQVTRDTLRLLGREGGYIAAPTHAVPGDVPPAAILAMLDVLQNQSQWL